MKRFKILILVLMIIGISAGVSHAMKMNIDPARIEIVIKPGEEKAGVVTVLNYDETNPIRVKAYVQDLVYLPDGSNDFLTPGSTPWSFNDWIKIGPTEFDIAPGKQQAVRYMISAPRDVRGGRYGVIFFETAAPPSQIKEVGATVNVRLGTVLLVSVEGTSIVKAKLKELLVKKSEKGKGLEASWTVSNDSNILVRPFGTLKIIDEDKKEIATIDVNKEKAGIFPGTNRKFTAQYKDVDKLSKGNYYVQLVLDYAGESLLGGQVQFKIE